ncbi:class A beta-lactamase-related serine hydrolase [Oceanobacillus luteolus]|uniref:Serine hydrolase n=1 Tax=Oceanobacillus luteolus TaxID=1274358 RepID=A0ABW4HT39_9BACI|nr:serine hydrolase [Oceanobacillus luteolus]MCM3739843.1 class A beta-lactamase-related serine hydrolase [Oceanobacillus luteolus]
MTSWAWIGLSGIVVLTLLPFLSKKQRSKEKIREAVITIFIVFSIIIAVLLFHVNYILALILGFIAFILLDKKTYTKKRLIIYGGIVLILFVTASFIFRDNPNYVLNHLKNNPDTTSLFVARNGEEIISYQADIVRPLASTVKIPIAIEYAFQVEEGLLDCQQLISLDELNKFYLKGTDGNAHEEWLKDIRANNKVKENQVTLHEIVKGMITYSSNANTEFLLHLLGVSEINKRINSLGLTDHEPIYPMVSPLLIPDYIANESSKDEIIEALEAMPIERYRELATDLSNRMEASDIDIESYFYKHPLDIQKIWSDRLPGASASDYARLLAIISNDELPTEAAAIMRDVMEWLMEFNEANHDVYAHFGSKGGSTAFILNDALYAEDLDGNKTEIVLFTDQLNLWENIMIGHNMNSFIGNIIGNETYREEVKQELN